ncbi:MAG TPA: hypothetical protein VLQ89_07025 [Candidatus Binatia bacterium]|nr:hypothetical protein [Candidatus Binatia bacterium]
MKIGSGASEVDPSMSQPAVKNDACRVLFFLVALALAIGLGGQNGSGVDASMLDEEQVRRAMRLEAFRLLALKSAGLPDGTTAGFDFHIDQVHDRISNRLPSGPLSASELEVWLRPLLNDPQAAGKDREIQDLFRNFVLGMSLEIITTLQFECEQAEDLIAQVGKLAAELAGTPRPGREALERAVQRLELNRRLPAMVKGVERRWRVPEPGPDTFRIFSGWKKNMTGRGVDRDLRLVFDLGDRYRDRFPFLDGFMENYRRLAEAFRLAVRDLDALLDAAGPAGS